RSRSKEVTSLVLLAWSSTRRFIPNLRFDGRNLESAFRSLCAFPQHGTSTQRLVGQTHRSRLRGSEWFLFGRRNRRTPPRISTFSNRLFLRPNSCFLSLTKSLCR